MYERTPPRYAAENPTRRPPPKASLTGSPDRIAMWAVVMAVGAMFAALVSSADGADGGVGVPTEESSTQEDVPVKGSTSRDLATWYGPGLYGNQTACGQTLKRRTVGVAHLNLPCGTRVSFEYKGRTITTKVIDRGPYSNHAEWDLTNGAAKQLNFLTTDHVRATVAG